MRFFVDSRTDPGGSSKIPYGCIDRSGKWLDRSGQWRELVAVDVGLCQTRG